MLPWAKNLMSEQNLRKPKRAALHERCLIISSFKSTVADLASGKDDGDGIDYVVMGVIGPDGKQAYAKREDAAAYCAFGGDAPCPAWDFAKNNGRWPDGGQISKGRHILRVIAVTESGKEPGFRLDDRYSVVIQC